ncbi:MAG: CRISPR-associated endoribonuclease Cas6 [Firmicutes bacterium]|nr:CRISPR-associated endoribonuclease Cas6 [Bacillota bacterium]
MVLTLEPVDEALLPVSHGAQAFAAALDLFLRLDPALARELHEGRAAKPLTVSPLSGPVQREGGYMRLAPGCRYDWRLTGLSAPVAAALLSVSPDLGGVRIGGAVFRIASVATQAGEHCEAGRTSYGELMNRAACAGRMSGVTLSFVTPTTFRQGEVELPFPLPRLVWGSLLDRWNAWSSTPFPDLKPLVEQSMVLANWKGETRRVDLGSRATVGFVGRFTYRMPGSPPELTWLVRLLAGYAFYAGVGWQTTHGMGQVRPQWKNV